MIQRTSWLGIWLASAVQLCAFGSHKRVLQNPASPVAEGLACESVGEGLLMAAMVLPFAMTSQELATSYEDKTHLKVG